MKKFIMVMTLSMCMCKGQTGPEGPVGPQGLTGPQGAQGLTGPTGSPGVPCAGCVDSISIQGGAITSTHITTGAIEAAHISPGAIDTIGLAPTVYSTITTADAIISAVTGPTFRIYRSYGTSDVCSNPSGISVLPGTFLEIDSDGGIVEMQFDCGVQLDSSNYCASFIPIVNGQYKAIFTTGLPYGAGGSFHAGFHWSEPLQPGKHTVNVGWSACGAGMTVCTLSQSMGWFNKRVFTVIERRR